MMPARVTPTLPDNMISTSERVTTMSEVSETASLSTESESVNEHLFKAIDEIYSPVLKLMRLFGVYYGDTNQKSFTSNSGRFLMRECLSLLHCGLVATGLLYNFILALLGCFLDPKNIFIKLLFSAWCLLVALSEIIFLMVSSLKTTRHSRFRRFVHSMVHIKGNASLKKAKSKSRQGIIVFFAVMFGANVGALITYFKLDINLASFKPFNESPVFAIVSQIFLVIGVGVWLLPILFFCNTCLIIVELFDDLAKKMSQQLLHFAKLDIRPLQIGHQKLCEVVELADEMFSPFLLGMIHSFQKIFRTTPIAKEDEGKLVIFMLDLQGDPKGISIGGLVVIRKSLSLTIAGVIISYFTVLLSIPK
ncbi:uncharacterized protein LOC111342607 isoform X2 [Stylophora pistillata]|uniref:uncharacterized protein LOC111342607 isoform X2 n=1 Tax=Stylophora pistillata TaxID=50429 RepID=UPI000C041DB1|nr:uncharacterized protein LOC111342607 isoform X2 [Stylophora pistillata]